jgi:tRNA threonylcarbamoyladenosine biosynthesis protein TsaE
VEPYELARATVYHFDLYRLADPEELELMGIRDYCRPDSLALIEWPDRGHPFLPPADLVITIHPDGAGRALEFAAQNGSGQRMLAALAISRG